MVPLVAAIVFLAPFAFSEEESCGDHRQFTFSWQFSTECTMRPRGGTTTGPSVTLDENIHKGWLAIQEDGISKVEKDRRAILAMAGPYRTSFDFLEVAGYSVGFEPAQPYQSWATEFVYLLENTPEFISLQHVIVMFFQEGEVVSGPVVMKHWRQDWRYEKPAVLAYVGANKWEHQKVPEEQLSGSWSQAVFQVDDSPRYESWGRWQHNANFSVWESADTWRPLPRRESSVRDDYHVLEGVNRHTILPNGWLHEETNYKLVLDEQSRRSSKPYLAKELGVNRYELIVDHDFSAGDTYMDKTATFWADVRAVWSEVISEAESLELKQGGGAPLFVVLFEAAETLNQNLDESAAKRRARIREIIKEYLD